MARQLTSAIALAIGLAAGSQAMAASPGETVFKQRCGTCHALEAGVPKMGPALGGVVGRKAGAVEGYKYSPAMQKAGFSWTTAQLDKFLTKPAAVVPGTKMMMGAPDAKQRADVIAYLASQKK